MKIIPIFLLLLFPVLTYGQAGDLCDIVNIPNCRGVTKQLRRNTFQTAPTTSTAANLNPANVSFDRGVGVEVLAQAKNPLLYSIISGTGKMGGALISGSMDNTFFGNRVPELNESLIERTSNDQQYKNRKFSAVLGGKLFSSKKAGLDLGLIVKRHSEVKDINVGAGLSGRLWLLHFGVSFFKDDAWIDLTKYSDPATGQPYSVSFGKDSHDENFLVTNYTIGTRIRNFGFDYGMIKSTLEFYDDEPTEISLYSASYHFRDFLLTAALRKEHSMAATYDEDEDEIKVEEDKSEMYYSLQYSLNKYIIMGVNYNYFLLKEFSLSATLFI